MGDYNMLSVLVVDDDPDMRLLTRRLLTMLGCQSFEARNGVEGESMALDIKPEAILLDIMMPVQDGYETCRNLRGQGYTGSIILVSALQEQTQKEKAQASGATAYIQKPLTRDVLKIHLDYIQAQLRV
jgi:CheY-like chemotaxis protein